MFSIKLSKKSLLFTLIISLSVAGYLNTYATIRTEQSIKFLLDELQSLDSESLVIFDLDDTLIQGIAYAPDDIKLAIRTTWYLINKILEKANTDTQKALVYKKLFKMKPDLVEAESPAIIKILQQHNIKTIGLTASFAGIYDTHGRVPCNADMRIAHLRLIDINFSSSFANIPYLTFNELEEDEEMPAFVGGILFSRPSEKGIVLETLLNNIGWKPNKIIFIDNLRTMVENVEQSAQKLEIPFLGVEFTGARTLPPLDPALFAIRVKYLIQNDAWLDDQAAYALIENPEYYFLKSKSKIYQQHIN